jgi:hypothetical protein
MDIPGATWQNVAIYYYDENKDQLILDGIQPLFREIVPQVQRAFFVRHWLRGPHVRLCFLCPQQQFNATVRPALEKQLGHYLQEKPSTTLLHEEKLRPAYQKLAILEHEAGPILPLYPDNSLQYIPYDRRLQVLKSDLLADFIERFYADANDLTFAMLEYIRQGQSRLLLCLDLMLTAAHTTAWPVTTGFVSYRSHADNFIIRSPNPAAMRAFFDEKYRTHADELTSRLPQLLTALDEKQDSFPFILPWSELLRRYWDEALPLIEAKKLEVTAPIPEDVLDERRRAALHSHSLFHTRLFALGQNSELLASTRFHSYRLMLNLLYLHLNRLGVRPVERFLLGHLAANTVEQVCGVSAVELVS